MDPNEIEIRRKMHPNVVVLLYALQTHSVTHRTFLIPNWEEERILTPFHNSMTTQDAARMIICVRMDDSRMDKENCPRATSAAAACIKRIWDVSWAHAIDRCYARSAIVFASGSIEASDCENSRDKELPGVLVEGRRVSAGQGSHIVPDSSCFLYTTFLICNCAKVNVSTGMSKSDLQRFVCERNFSSISIIFSW